MIRSLALLSAVTVAALLVPARPVIAQTVTAPATPTNIKAGDDWATTTFHAPIDMSQYTDIAWWTYANDAPLSDFSALAYGPCTTLGATTDPLSSCLRVTTMYDPNPLAPVQSNFWILETPNPQSADIHRNGTNFPIDANVYNMVAVRMRLDSGSHCPVANATAGCITSLLWNRNSLYDGIGVTQTNFIFTYDGWGIYLIDLTKIGLAALPNPTPWAGVIRDLRYNLQQMTGASVEIDWIRLVPNNLPTQTISWSGFGGNVDIYLDNDSIAGNGNLGLIVQANSTNTTSPAVNLNAGTYSFPAGALAPGTYFAEVCPAGALPTSGSCKYSAGSFKVNDIPTLTFTSPSPEGGDDFATTVLGNPWDMNATSDIDYYANISGLAVAPLLNSVDEAGNTLGSVNALQGTGLLGDPFLYPLWFTNNLPGFTGRGLTKKIDANKYHILTFEAGIPNQARDISAGSVARIFWQVQGDAINGNPNENTSDDIILNSRAGANVIAKVTTDMKTLRLDPSAAGAKTGWTGNIESFRFDPDEFAGPTPFYLRRIKLAANERAGKIYTIQWNYSDPFLQSGTPTLTLYYDTDTDPSSGLVQIAAGVNPITGSYAWDTTGVPNGSYYIYASFSDGINTNGTYSRWPIIAGPAATSTLTLSPVSIQMAGTKSGATLEASTPAQDVSVAMSGTSGPWTATADQSWVNITNASGTGAGRFTVSVINPGDVIGSSTSLSATITVSEPAIGLTTTLPVSLSVVNSPNGTAALPFGVVDTPGNGTVGVTGSIPVTGWALDDVGVARVTIYRNCLSIDNPATCQTVAGNSLVLIGDAAFVAGARPDVEAVHPSLPLAYRAGWGYLLLTNMLPHVTPPSNPAGGGQGSVTLYVFAIDAENQRVLLGTREIIMDNDHATKPFGGIDTPSQGGLASGLYANYGWALTPGTAQIPIDGSTMTLVVDGVALGGVQYNLCRDGASPPSGPGACHDDIATLFPTMSNITLGSGAIGLSNIDTTRLTDGVHTIAWSVTDNQGHVDGLGSRFFSVLNGGSSLTASDSALRASSSVTSITNAMAAAPQVLGAASDVAWRSVSDRDVTGRSGYDFEVPLETIDADSAGVRRVRMPELGRIELRLSRGTTAGYLRSNGTLRPLPPGSQFDPSTGQFTWAPGPGYIGTYDLVFLQDAAQVPVEVTIEQKRSETAGLMRGWVDAPATGETVAGRFIVAGWALDTAAWQGAGVGAVHVWARRRDVPASSAVFLGAADLGGVRPDVAAAYGPQFSHAGWGLSASGLASGTYDVTAFFWSTRTDRFEDARTTTITVK